MAFAYEESYRGGPYYRMCNVFRERIEEGDVSSIEEVGGLRRVRGVLAGNRCQKPPVASSTTPSEPTTSPPTSITTAGPKSCVPTTVSPPTGIPHVYPTESFANTNSLTIDYEEISPWNPANINTTLLDRPAKIEQCLSGDCKKFDCEAVFVFLYTTSTRAWWGCWTFKAM